MENIITLDCDCPNCDNEFEQVTVSTFKCVVCPACDYIIAPADFADFIRVL